MRHDDTRGLCPGSKRPKERGIPRKCFLFSVYNIWLYQHLLWKILRMGVVLLPWVLACSWQDEEVYKLEKVKTWSQEEWWNSFWRETGLRYGCVAWGSWGDPSRGSRAVSDSLPVFLPIGLPHAAVMWRFVPRLIIMTYSMFDWHLWEACSFLRGNGGAVDLRERWGRGDRVEKREEKLWLVRENK